MKIKQQEFLLITLVILLISPTIFTNILVTKAEASMMRLFSKILTLTAVK
jgi:hypothetical protein